LCGLYRMQETMVTTLTRHASFYGEEVMGVTSEFLLNQAKWRLC